MTGLFVLTFLQLSLHVSSIFGFTTFLNIMLLFVLPDFSIRKHKSRFIFGHFVTFIDRDSGRGND